MQLKQQLELYQIWNANLVLSKPLSLKKGLKPIIEIKIVELTILPEIWFSLFCTTQYKKVLYLRASTICRTTTLFSPDNKNIRSTPLQNTFPSPLNKIKLLSSYLAEFKACRISWITF